MSAHPDLADLKRRHSLAALVQSAGVALRRAGEGRLLGRCPFHDDHRPSFLVDERDQHFHCFACGAHGDILDFVQRREGLTLRQAMRRLDDRPPSPAPAPTLPPGQARRWDRLTLEEQVVMNTAAAIYQHALWHTPRALDYLRGRGLPDWLIRRAGLGYADGHSLESWLRRRSGLQLARTLGLLGPKGTERLAGRIVVPERRGGQCIWLIGRALEETPERAKYVALPGERPLLGQEHVAGRRQVFLVEGVFDLLTALGWGLPACSPAGTALPPERLGCLARAGVVYGVFDGDEAGRAAAQRFAALLGGRWCPLTMPEGCDLNDLGRRPDGRAVFFQVLAEARRRSASAAATKKGADDGGAVSASGRASAE